MGFELLQEKEFLIFTTKDFACVSQKSLSSASKQLKRWQKRGVLHQITRGIWANTRHPHFSIYSLVPFLLGHNQGYISLLTALHLNGMISQIPRTVQVVTTGFPRKLRTPIGDFEFFKMKPEMHRSGMHWSESKIPFRIAGPEKALLDVIYLSTRKGNRFKHLPEIEFPKGFKKRTFYTLMENQIQSLRIKGAMRTYAGRLLA